MNKGLTIFHEAPLSVFDKVQKMTDKYVANIEKAIEDKSKEIMTV